MFDNDYLSGVKEVSSWECGSGSCSVLNLRNLDSSVLQEEGYSWKGKYFSASLMNESQSGFWGELISKELPSWTSIGSWSKLIVMKVAPFLNYCYLGKGYL